MSMEPWKWSHSAKEVQRPSSFHPTQLHDSQTQIRRAPKLGSCRGNSCSPRLSFDDELTLRRHPAEMSRLAQTDSVTNRWARQPRRTLPRMPVSESEGKKDAKREVVEESQRQRSHSTPRGNWTLVKNSIDHIVPTKDKRKGILKAESLSEAPGKHNDSVLNTKWKSSHLH